MPSIKAVFFDMDGVLLDSMDAWFETYNDTLEQYGYKRITLEEFYKSGGRSIQNDIKEQFTQCTPEELNNAFVKNFTTYAHKAQVDPQAKETIQWLKQRGIICCVVTNAAKKIAITVLQKAELLELFNGLIGADDVSQGKPNPEGILKLCKQFQFNPNEVLFVGDTHNDEGAANTAGCRFLKYETRAQTSLLDSVSTALK